MIEVLAGAQGALDARNDGRAEDSGEEDVIDGEEEPTGLSRMLKSIRQLGLKRLVEFFRCPAVYGFTSYLPGAFRGAISPRLPSLNVENTRAPGALLDLFHAWAQRQEYTVYLVRYDDAVLPRVDNCLIATNIKPAVITKVFDIIEQLQSQSVADDTILESFQTPRLASSDEPIHSGLVLSNYVTSTTSLDHHFDNDAILAVGSMANRLNWGAYYTVVQHWQRTLKGIQKLRSCQVDCHGLRVVRYAIPWSGTTRR